MEITATRPSELTRLIPMARAITELLGRRCEVVIHDFSDRSALDHTIVAVEGNLTGRKPGGPPTDYLLRKLRTSEELPDYMVYPGRTPDGRPLRCATTFVRDDEGRIIGSICINLELTDFLMARAILDDLCQVPDPENGSTSPSETFAKDPDQTLESIVQAAAKDMGKPIAYMDRQDKVRLVSMIEDRGGFLMRGSVERVAKALGVSRYTVYNYINESKGDRSESGV